MKNFLALIALLCTLPGFAQQADFNLELLSNVDFAPRCNDVWAYVDSDGTEYAIIGTTEATEIVRLADPSNPERVATIPGHNSTWRDFKVYRNYLYVTTDLTSDVNRDGLIIVDMTDIANNNVDVKRVQDVTDNGANFTLEVCHNLYIDTTEARLYLSGCNVNGGSIIAFDLGDDPWNPEFAFLGPGVYSHDNYSRGDFIYTADLTAGFRILNASNGDLVGDIQTGFNFCHNVWIDDEAKYAFTTDERGNAFVESYDISDPENIEFLDAYRPAATVGRGVIPHNTHYIDGYLVTSYYTDGLKIIDGNRPTNLVEVASYDTWDGADGGFNGLWGATPFLPSGLILGSDISTGLYVWKPTYQRASYLEGIVVDDSTEDPIMDATITVKGENLELTETSDARGNFTTGAAGDYEVTIEVTAPGYAPLTVVETITSGNVTDVQLRMIPKDQINVTVKVLDAETGDPIENAAILLQGTSESFEGQTDDAGTLELSAFSENYDVITGAWGFDRVSQNLDLADGQSLSIMLNRGDYADDFELDFGWESSGDATTGLWVLAEPAGTSSNGFPVQSDEDVPDDNGTRAFITGNNSVDVGADDIDGGDAILRSPPMDLSAYNEPVLNFDYWFFRGGGSSASQDSMIIYMINGSERVELFNTVSVTGEWNPSDDIVITGLDLSVPVQLEVLAFDRNAGNLVEAGIDVVRVFDANVTSNEDIISNSETVIAPNPTASTWDIIVDDRFVNGEIIISNTLGQVMYRQLVQEKVVQLGHQLTSGTYFIQLKHEGLKETLKVIKTQ